MYVRKRKWQCAIQDSLPPAQDESFLIDCQSAILHCLSLPALAVRVQASWALANFTDPLPFSPHPTLKHSLYSATTKALRDADKVRCNGVRAAGNLLKELTEKGNGSLETCTCIKLPKRCPSLVNIVLVHETTIASSSLICTILKRIILIVIIIIPRVLFSLP